MPALGSRKSFLESQDAATMRIELLSMLNNPAYNTSSGSVAKKDFVEKHINYISRFSYIDPRQYVLNLKMKSRM